MAAIAVLALWSAAALHFFYHQGYILYYGDAEAHLNIARRVSDSRTPGYDQIGTVWLPLPHLLMMPMARRDDLWRSGLAGAIPSAAAFVIAAAFLFAASRRIFGSNAPALTATALFALNPNLMYLQSTPMTEPMFFACLLGLLYFTVRYQATQGWGALAGASLAALAGTLVRYEGWFVLPFAAGYILLVSKRQRFLRAAVFCGVAALGPLYWMGHNWWLDADPLGFWRGPYSAAVIQGGKDYPGKGDWPKAWLFYSTAARMCAGTPLFWMGVVGLAAAVVRRLWWAVALLALPGVFYLWSMHSSGTPIFVPTLWFGSHYNTRYGLAVLPLLAMASAALVAVTPERWRTAALLTVIAVGIAPWVAYPRPESWITWKESQANSVARRAWTHEAADYLRTRYVRGTGIATSFGDLSGILREAGIPLREAFTGDNGVPWLAATTRPELFLHEGWAITMGGDPVQTAVWRLPRFGRHYTLDQTIIVKHAPVIEIYRH